MIEKSWKNYDILNNTTINLDIFSGINLDRTLEKYKLYHLDQERINLNLGFLETKFANKL